MYCSWNCQSVYRNMYLSNGCANIKRCHLGISQSGWCVLILLDGPFGHRTSYGGFKFSWPACLYVSTLNDRTLGSVSACHIKNTGGWVLLLTWLWLALHHHWQKWSRNQIQLHEELLLVLLLRNICRKGVEVAVRQLRWRSSQIYWARGVAKGLYDCCAFCGTTMHSLLFPWQELFHIQQYSALEECTELQP